MTVLAKQQTLKLTKLKPHIGAEATGVDLRRPLAEADRRRLYAALVDHVCLVVRGQNFGAAEFQAAASLFGELMEDQDRSHLAPGLPLVSLLSNRFKDSRGKPAKVAKNSTWHTDHTNQELPPKFTTLYPVELPDAGGGTSVCNMHAAYEALPADLKERIGFMRTANTLISSARAEFANPDILSAERERTGGPTIQPLVRTHPERGTKAIWFHTGKTENILGLGPEETQSFLAELLEAAIRPEFVYLHEWRPGDMLLIDNRSAMHKAGFDYDPSQHRMLYRILVRGDRPY